MDGFRYFSTTNDVLTSVKKMEESLKRLKRGKASQSVGGMSDDDKIRLQLYLDVQEYGKQVSILCKISKLRRTQPTGNIKHCSICFYN